LLQIISFHTKIYIHCEAVNVGKRQQVPLRGNLFACGDGWNSKKLILVMDVACMIIMRLSLSKQRKEIVHLNSYF